MSEYLFECTCHVGFFFNGLELGSTGVLEFLNQAGEKDSRIQFGN